MDRNFLGDLRDTSSFNLLQQVLDTEKENSEELSQKSGLLFLRSEVNEIFRPEDLTKVVSLVADQSWAALLFLDQLLYFMDLYKYSEETRQTSDWFKAKRIRMLKVQQAFNIALEIRAARDKNIVRSVIIEGLGKTHFFKDNMLITDSMKKKIDKMEGKKEEGDDDF